jgi:hypothetical protein
MRTLPVPDDPYGRLWRGAELVREHRGDSHLAAIAGSGLGTSEVNVLTEVWLGYPIGEYSASRGLASDASTAAAVRLAELGLIADGLLTDSGRSRRVAIEAATDAGQRELVDALGDHLDHTVALAEQITASVLRAHAAPADPRKRAAG